MDYRNSEMKIDQLISYLNEQKINLSPAFQRGRVWPTNVRRKLVKNIVLGMPIPAIFLYKEAVGTKYTYNILDGKQRLESIMLFVTDSHPDVRIQNWWQYFFGVDRKTKGFYIDLPEGKTTFANLSEGRVRDFREYVIPTIEISLGDDSSLEEVITLFVDINQQGVAVTRFDIVKAMYQSDPLLKGVLQLIAVQQKRGQDVFYKAKKTPFTDVLKQLSVVENLAAPNAKVNKMWEKMLEICLFVRTGEHRKPLAILKEFITSKKTKPAKIKPDELAKLQEVFSYLASSRNTVKASRLFTDQTHSYTLVTALLRNNLINNIGRDALRQKLMSFAQLLDGKKKSIDRSISTKIKKYIEESAKQTTDVSRRVERERLFLEIIHAI